MKRINRVNHVHARIDEMDFRVKTESENMYKVNMCYGAQTKPKTLS